MSDQREMLTRHHFAPSSFPALLAVVSLVASSAGCSKRDEEPAQSPGSASRGSDAKGPPQVGDLAPDFEAVAHSGQRVKLSELRGKVVVLYFYPKDGTPGCTTEAQGFRDQYQSFDQAGAVILGVSTQDNESHRAFAEKHHLPFLLLPDEDSDIAKAYGVGSILGFSKRVTFIIDREGKIAQVHEKVSPPGHAREILEVLSVLGEDDGSLGTDEEPNQGSDRAADSQEADTQAADAQAADTQAADTQPAGAQPTPASPANSQPATP